MVQRGIFHSQNIDSFKLKVTLWLKQFDVACILDSHSKQYPSHPFSFSDQDMLIAAGAIKEISPLHGSTLKDLETYKNQNGHWLFGYFSYELKNQFEKLESNNTDFLNWPDFYFFVPQVIISIKESQVVIEANDRTFSSQQLFDSILDIDPSQEKDIVNKVNVNARLTKPDYIEKIEALRKHILRGDIYEINFCQEFYAITSFNPYWSQHELNKISPTPFSSFFKLNENFLVSASPERYLKKEGCKLISQPIKGTSKRGKTLTEDQQLIEKLKNTPKERSENIMIVDLVRNDLAKIATKNTVKVDELCGIYTFEQVHQMISTVSCQTDTHSLVDILRATFPMGSMTGAPKVSAMKLSEQYETSKRGLYSGAVGYISPNNNFDFNVVIRSLQYNAKNQYLSYMVGGAITHLSDAEKEYEECLVKAAAINKLLNMGNYD